MESLLGRGAGRVVVPKQGAANLLVPDADDVALFVLVGAVP
jgi:hypothetical protein